MKKEFLYNLGGLIAIIASVALFFFFITSLDDGANIALFIGSLVLVSAGVFAFIRSTKITNPPKEPFALAPAPSDNEYDITALDTKTPTNQEQSTTSTQPK